ncbi:MAG: hypothetical protein OXC07_04245 [Kistimonas sp.]|nr:hypothetical protein [Kistimonas sp.]
MSPATHLDPRAHATHQRSVSLPLAQLSPDELLGQRTNPAAAEPRLVSAVAEPVQNIPPPSSQTPPKRSLSAARRDALTALQENLKSFVNVNKLLGILDEFLQEQDPGDPILLNGEEVDSIKTESGRAEQMQQLLTILHGKGDKEFYQFVRLLEKAGYAVWPHELRLRAQKIESTAGQQEPPVTSAWVPDLPCTTGSELFTQQLTCLQAALEDSQRQAHQYFAALQEKEKTITQLQQELAAIKETRHQETAGSTTSSTNSESKTQCMLQ